MPLFPGMAPESSNESLTTLHTGSPPHLMFQTNPAVRFSVRETSKVWPVATSISCPSSRSLNCILDSRDTGLKPDHYHTYPKDPAPVDFPRYRLAFGATHCDTYSSRPD